MLQTGTSKSIFFSAKQEGVWTYYECARGMAIVWTLRLQRLFHSLIIPLFTYGISVWGVASYEKYLSKIDKFQTRTVRFGFLRVGRPR